MTITRIGLGIGATAIAAAMVFGAASVYARAQDTSTADGRRGPDGRGRGGPGGPGGPGRPGGPGGRGGPMGAMGRGGPAGLPLGQLDLNDAQRQTIDAIFKAHESEMRGLQDRMNAAHEALNAVITTDTVNEGAIRARSADLAAVDADMAVAQARVRAEVFSRLTPEQQAKARAFTPPPGGRRGPPPPR